MLWVLAVELGWVSLLLFWSRQRALNDDGEADSWAAPATAAVAAAAADDSPAPQATMERSASQEMRVLLAERREHVPLWHAYGQQLYKAGQAKVIFYASCHCLGACISCI